MFLPRNIQSIQVVHSGIPAIFKTGGGRAGAHTVLGCLLQQSLEHIVLEHPARFVYWLVSLSRRTNRLLLPSGDFKVNKLFGFAVTPLRKDVTNTLLYNDYPRWPFLGGPGYLMAIQFGDSPIGKIVTAAVPVQYSTVLAASQPQA